MRLLIALHLDDHGAELVAQAVTWAWRLGAVLDLLYVDEHAHYAVLLCDPAIGVIYDRDWWRLHENRQCRLSWLLQQVPAELRGVALLRFGSACEEIVETAKDRDAVLIWTHGRRGWSHALHGSVAERVVRLAPVPVFVLRHPADRPAARPPSGWFRSFAPT